MASEHAVSHGELMVAVDMLAPPPHSSLGGSELSSRQALEARDTMTIGYLRLLTPGGIT